MLGLSDFGSFEVAKPLSFVEVECDLASLTSDSIDDVILAALLNSSSSQLDAFASLKKHSLDALLSNNHNDHATILLGEGNGRFAFSPPLRMGNRGWHLAVLDFDKDGKPDLIAVTESSVRIFFGDGHGGFSGVRLVIPSGGKGCWKLALGDLNEDGTPDVVTPNVESHDLTVLLSQKSGGTANPR